MVQAVFSRFSLGAGIVLFSSLKGFLAEMSSSKSYVVTQCVRNSFIPPCVPFFFLSVSLEFFLVLKSFNGVSIKFKGKGCLKFKGCFTDV